MPRLPCAPCTISADPASVWVRCLCGSSTKPDVPFVQARPGADCPDPLAVEQTQILCPCVPEEFPTHGACPTGLQCAAATQNPLWDPSGDPLWVQDVGFICQPCVYGQYCPRGSFQPISGPALLQYVDRYSCRYTLPWPRMATCHFEGS